MRCELEARATNNRRITCRCARPLQSRLSFLYLNTTAHHMAATRAPAAPTAPASLVVAKTMLTATLLRPDPTQVAVAKDDIQSFHSLLDAVVLTCSPSNLQV